MVSSCPQLSDVWLGEAPSFSGGKGFFKLPTDGRSQWIPLYTPVSPLVTALNNPKGIFVNLLHFSSLTPSQEISSVAELALLTNFRHI